MIGVLGVSVSTASASIIVSDCDSWLDIVELVGGGGMVLVVLVDVSPTAAAAMPFSEEVERDGTVDAFAVKADLKDWVQKAEEVDLTGGEPVLLSAPPPKPP